MHKALMRCYHVLVKAVTRVPKQLRSDFKEWRRRRCIFEHASTGMTAWDLLLGVMAIGNAIIIPLTAVFGTEVGFRGDWLFLALGDLVFLLDVPVKMRTSYRDHGFDIIDPKRVAHHYLTTWFVPDSIAAIPAMLLFVLVRTAYGWSGGYDNQVRQLAAHKVG